MKQLTKGCMFREVKIVLLAIVSIFMYGYNENPKISYYLKAENILSNPDYPPFS
jgi:hypothetical protein